MTAPTDAVFIKFPNTLKHRAERGRGVTIEDMLQAADQVLESTPRVGAIKCSPRFSTRALRLRIGK